MNSSGLAAEALNVAHELAKLLDTGLDREQLSVCIALLETGVNPEVGQGSLGHLVPRNAWLTTYAAKPGRDPTSQALAEVVRQLRSQDGASTPPSSS